MPVHIESLRSLREGLLKVFETNLRLELLTHIVSFHSLSTPYQCINLQV